MPRYFIKDTQKRLTEKERQIRKKFVMCSFLRYLKTREIYGKFYFNFSKAFRYSKDDSYNNLDEYLINIQRWPSDAISAAFTWIETQQGERYWVNLHNDWKDIWITQLQNITYSS